MDHEEVIAMMTQQQGLVLLDVAADDSAAAFDRSFLERTDHPVTTCHGPDVKTLCPLLGGYGCDRFEEAHGVVFKLDLDRAQHRAILRRYRDLKPDLPIRVMVRPDQARRYAALLAHFQVWTHEPNAADLDGFAAELEAADRFAA